MSKRSRFRLKAVATSMDGEEIPIPEKPKIDKDSPRDVIQHKDRTFEIHSDMIHYFSQLPEVLEDRIERALGNGMMHMYPNGGYGCHYCGYYTQNISNLVDESEGEGFVHNVRQDPNLNVRGCTYEGTMDIRWAGTFTNKNSGIIVIARKASCVVWDSMLVELIEKGLLDEYEVEGREFNFPTLQELGENAKLIEQYRVDRVEPTKRSFLRRLYDTTIGKLF